MTFSAFIFKKLSNSRHISIEANFYFQAKAIPSNTGPYKELEGKVEKEIVHKCDLGVCWRILFCGDFFFRSKNLLHIPESPLVPSFLKNGFIFFIDRVVLLLDDTPSRVPSLFLGTWVGPFMNWKVYSKFGVDRGFLYALKEVEISI